MQSIPLAVLKLRFLRARKSLLFQLHAVHTACGIETNEPYGNHIQVYQLHAVHTACGIETKLFSSNTLKRQELHAVHTACGIETER